MPLTLTSDPSRPGGGYAILQVDTGAAPASLAFEDRSTGLFLAPGGKWTKQPHHFDVERIDATRVRLGPDIVDHVDADAILALHRQDAGVLGVQVLAGDPAERRRPPAATSCLTGSRWQSSTPLATAPRLRLVRTARRARIDGAGASSAAASAAHPGGVRAETGGAGQARRPAQADPDRQRLAPANLSACSPFAERTRPKLWSANRLARSTGSGLSKALSPARKKPPSIPEETAYNDFLQCVPGQPACAQKRCGNAYLSAFVYGAHAAKVRAASAAVHKPARRRPKKITPPRFSRNSTTACASPSTSATARSAWTATATS